MPIARTMTYAVILLAFLVPGTQALEFHDALTRDGIPSWEVKVGAPDTWVVQDGVLSCTGAGGWGGWIGTKADYTDFVIELEFKLPPEGNSGVFLRIPKTGHPSAVGMEVQLLDDYAAKHKDLKPAQYCGSIYKIVPPAKRAVRPAGEWNHIRVTAEGEHVVVVLNGETVVDADSQAYPVLKGRTPRGSIGLQTHRNPVWFRNIRIADLAADRAQRTQWWRDAKFGLFIHWGVYSVIGEGEWIMKVRTIPAAEYEKLPPQFNPTGFNAAEWVSLAQRAGQKYLVITSKHHDGFAMFDSKAGDYDIVDRTPFKHDPMKDLAEECRKQGLPFGFYHSILDWHHPDYSPVPDWDKPARAGHLPDFDKYLAYMQGQVRELCTNYGPLACLWWDGGWAHTGADDRRKLAKVNAMIRELPPSILINNRANNPEDFDTPEQFIPPTGLTNPDGTPKLWENCITLTTGHGSHPPTAWWGYDKNETEFKTPEFCIRMLVDIVSKGGNLLLNVGPTPQGRIGPKETAVLEAMGRWLAVNGSAIYGTTASPFRYLPFFGRATVKGNVLYLHVFDWPKDHRLVLPGVKNQARSAHALSDSGTALEVQRVQSDLVVTLPDKAGDPIATVVAVELDGPPRVEPFVIRPGGDGTIALPVLYGDIRGRHGQRARFESLGGEVQLGNWTNLSDYITWQFDAGPGGTFEVQVTGAAAKAGGTFELAAGAVNAKPAATAPAAGTDTAAGGIFDVGPDAARIQGQVQDTGGSDRFTTTVGQLKLPAGLNVLAIKPVKLLQDAPLMNLRQVTLKPMGR